MTAAVLWAIVILVGGGIVLLLAGRRLEPRWSAWAALVVGLGAGIPFTVLRGPEKVVLWEWLSGTGGSIAIVYRFDASAQALALVAVIPALLLLLWMGLGAMDEEGPFAGGVLLLLGLFLHLVSSADLLLTYAGWEVLILGTYFLLTYRRAGLPTPGIAEWFLGGQHLAGFALLFALLGVGQPTGTWQYANLYPGSVGSLALTLLLVTVWVRTALVPFQGWAMAIAEGPGPVSTLLLGSWALLPGPYLWLRFLAQSAEHTPRDVAMVAGCAALLLGAVLAMRQESGRRVQAGDTVSRMGLVWLALGLDSSLGVAAGLFLLQDLLLSKVTFHLALSGNGLARPTRQMLYLVGAWEAVGLPPSLGFVGRWLLVLGLVEAGRLFYLPFVLLAVPLTLAYLWHGWTLVPAGSPPAWRFELVAQRAIAVLVALLSVAGLAGLWLWPLLDGPSQAAFGGAVTGVQVRLEALLQWMPAWVILLLLVVATGVWWSGALRQRAAAEAEVPGEGPLQEALPVLPRETGWLAWLSRPAPLSRFFAQAAGALGVALHSLVNFLERHTTYFLLVVLVAAAVVLVVLTR